MRLPGGGKLSKSIACLGQVHLTCAFIFMVSKIEIDKNAAVDALCFGKVS